MAGIIEEIRVTPIRMPNRVPVKLSTGTLLYQDNVIVEIRSGTVCGIGETEPLLGFQGCHENHQTIVPLIRNLFADKLIGRNASNVTELAVAMWQLNGENPYALNAVVNALYDLAARLRGVPLSHYLGETYRTRIGVVWTIGIKERDAMAAEARLAVSKGYRLLKLKIGGRNIEDDIENVASVRAAVGGEIGLRADANGSLDLVSAKYLTRSLERFRLDLLEQPLDIDDIDGMAELTASTSIPIMPDESLTTPASAKEIVKKRAASIFGMKLAKHGGIRNGIDIAQIAERAGITVYPGNQVSTSVGTATAAHFFASVKTATIGGDLHVGPAFWLADDIVQKPIQIDSGYLQIPCGIGIGVNLNHEKLEQYKVAI
jgi:muconate cycloisomerase